MRCGFNSWAPPAFHAGCVSRPWGNEGSVLHLKYTYACIFKYVCTFIVNRLVVFRKCYGFGEELPSIEPFFFSFRDSFSFYRQLSLTTVTHVSLFVSHTIRQCTRAATRNALTNQ